MQVSTMDDNADPVSSIDKGASMLADLWHKTNGNVEKTLAAYNMGDGILSYIDAHPDMSVPEAMQNFSDMQKERHGYKVYGDPQYIAHVSRYFNQ